MDICVCGGFRDPNFPNLGNGILKVSGEFETEDKLRVLGMIAIRAGELLISGCDLCIRYISVK